MNKLRLGCHTITWGEQQSQFLPRVCQELAAAGYEGMEIGFHHIQATAPAQLKQLLKEHGLKLIGTHIGGNLRDTSQGAGERAILDVVLDYLSEVGSMRLLYSGLRYKSPAQFKRDLSMLSDADETARQRGVELLYHNHDWEFADDGRIIEALIGHTDVRFCPDIGWMMRGLGHVDGVVPLLDRMRLRIGALHMKDFATVRAGAGQMNTVMLGEGVAPLREAAAWAARYKPRLWLIAEQDLADGSPQQAIAANSRFLYKLI